MKGIRQEYTGRLELALNCKCSKSAMTALVRHLVDQLKQNVKGRLVQVHPTYINRTGLSTIEFDDTSTDTRDVYTGRQKEREIVVTRSSSSTCIASQPKGPFVLVSCLTTLPFTPLTQINDLFTLLPSADRSLCIILRDVLATRAAHALQELLLVPLDRRVVKILDLEKLCNAYRYPAFDPEIQSLAGRNIQRFALLPMIVKFSAKSLPQVQALEQEMHMQTLSGIGSFDNAAYRSLGDAVLKTISIRRPDGLDSFRNYGQLVERSRGELEEVEVCEEKWAVTQLWPVDIEDVDSDDNGDNDATQSDDNDARKSAPQIDDSAPKNTSEDIKLVTDVQKSHWAKRALPPRPIFQPKETIVKNDQHLHMEVERRKRTLTAQSLRSEVRKARRIDLAAKPQVVKRDVVEID